MTQQSLRIYLDIIQELLTCPSGEEWIRLKRHEDRVNPELVQIMEQVASQLLREGNRDAAIFLHNWAAKLHHILVKETTPPTPESDRSDDYGAFIQALLSGDEEEEASLLAAHQDLIGPGLIQKMHQVAQQLQQQGTPQQVRRLQRLADELSHAWVKAHEFQPAFQKAQARRPTPDVDRPAGLSGGPGQPEQPETNTSAEMPLTSAPQLEINQQLADAISEIARSLRQLNQTLATQTAARPPAANPLWYMDALERAAAAQWLLTTEEIEHLIGVKPKCHGQEKTYQRGIWKFIKVGKLGAQTAWQVTKAQLDAPQSGESRPNASALDGSEPGVSGSHRLGGETELNGGYAGASPAHLAEMPDMTDLWT